MANKRVICEADVLALAAGESLLLDAHSVATPSALDAAFQRGIAVVRPGEGGASGARGAGGKKDCLWHRILENDGTYVVQVIDGQASVSRLGAAGPVAFGMDSVQEHNL